MKNLVFSDHSYPDSAKIMTETSRQFLSKQLARVIALNLMCLVLFAAFCAAMAFGSLSLLINYWNEHRAASVVEIMIVILAIPGLAELTALRLGLWKR